jgi:hypothetical protein
MYYYNNNDKDDPSINITNTNGDNQNHSYQHHGVGESINFDSNQLFGTSFEDLNNLNDLSNPFLNFGTSLSSHFDSNIHNSTSSSSPSPNQQQQQDYSNHSNNNNLFNSDNKINNPSIFLQDLDEQQQANILLSDPSFLRQQQLLLQEQKQQQPMKSNLSAMFSQSQTKEQPQQLEPIALVSSQQQKKDIQRRSISGASVSKNTKPIPISSSLPSSTSQQPTIDHQRRFNELQARFRINYAKKPSSKQQQQQQQAVDSTGTSVPITYNEQQQHLSSSFNESSPANKRKLSLEPSTKPLLRMNSIGSKIKVAGGGGMAIPNSSNNTPTTPTSVTPSSFPSRTMPIQIHRVHRANSFQPFDLEQRQKRLDDQLTKVDFNDITVSELKEMLRQRGKPATGKKAILLSRLQEEKDLILHARANGISISNRYATAQSPMESSASPIMEHHAASLPDSSSSMYLSSSPNNNSTVGSLNRSIADMHIGSPPPPTTLTSQQSRRFAPYGATAIATSSRQNPSSSSSSSPSPFYSSSVPTGSLDMMMMTQHQQQQQSDIIRVMKGFNFSKKTYAPFASSALATPDRDDNHNPFDDLIVKEEGENTEETKGFMSPNDMEWTDPTLDFMMQQSGKLGLWVVVLGGVSSNLTKAYLNNRNGL